MDDGVQSSSVSNMEVAHKAPAVSGCGGSLQPTYQFEDLIWSLLQKQKSL